MAEKVVPGPVTDEVSIREAVCIHTKKVFDSCRDKDCIEDLRVFPTVSSQAVLDSAVSVKAGAAELLYTYIDVQPVSFNRGFYTVDVRYFYRVTADAFTGAARPTQVTGLAIFDKRVILFGSEGSAKVFSSDTCALDCQCLANNSMPSAVVEAVDPIVLNVKLAELCECRAADGDVSEVPARIFSAFGEDLVFRPDVRRMYVSLGQFSIVRMERDTQLLMPAYDYCMPEKECAGAADDDPCEVFRHVKFPVDEFFPPDTVCPCSDNYRDVRGG